MLRQHSHSIQPSVSSRYRLRLILPQTGQATSLVIFLVLPSCIPAHRLVFPSRFKGLSRRFDLHDIPHWDPQLIHQDDLCHLNVYIPTDADNRFILALGAVNFVVHFFACFIICHAYLHLVCPGHPAVACQAGEDAESPVQFFLLFRAHEHFVRVQLILAHDRKVEPPQGIKGAKILARLPAGILGCRSRKGSSRSCLGFPFSNTSRYRNSGGIDIRRIIYISSASLLSPSSNAYSFAGDVSWYGRVRYRSSHRTYISGISPGCNNGRSHTHPEDKTRSSGNEWSAVSLTQPRPWMLQVLPGHPVRHSHDAQLPPTQASPP